MSSSSPASLLDVDLQPGKPPMLRAAVTGDAPSWAAEHRDALRAVVAEHGSVLVRGLGLRDAAEIGAVFQRLATGLMTEKEAFAPRRTYSDGVYSSSKWPPNQPMCMHHELSYTLEFPGLMLLACLSAPTDGGATAVADSPTVLDALPTELIKRNEWTIAPEVREYLVDVYGNDGLPFNTRFGNGDPIGEDVVQLLNTVYEANTARQPWQTGDLMLVDNVRTAHSRDPFTGSREVLVAMADAVRLADCSPTVEVTAG